MRIKMNCEVQEQQKLEPQQHQQQQQQQSSQPLSPPQQPQQQQQQQQESSDDDDLSTTERQNLEFAKKLGYSDQSIHSALTRLGSEAKQNELLAELIKLTADAPRPATNSNSLTNSQHHSITSSSAPLSTGGGSLRHIVIDGSNVALSHGNNLIFSCRGIRICVDWFRQRGHRDITAFVPNWRKEMANNNISDQELLYELEHERVLVFTPSRHLDGKRVSCYDDRFILKLAVETDGIVVSNDNYRDLILESNEYRKVVQERLLMYSFVNDIFMPPDDPLGRSGPTLDQFLYSQTQQKMADAQQLCPYGKKCTYGQKCKFRHQQTCPLLQRLPLQASHSAPLHTNGGQPLTSGHIGNNIKINSLINREPLGRTKSNTIEKVSQQQLCQAFTSQLEVSETAADNQPNRHKKLQRQQPPPAYRLLVPTYSAPLQQQQQQPQQQSFHHHQYLTRTPSAPVTDQGLALPLPAHNFSHLSASDSRINEELHATQMPREEQRRLLRYHLSSLFPPHQVHAVLQLYPDETDAKTICAAIINLFPHN